MYNNTKITDELLIDELKIRISRYHEALSELQSLNIELKDVNKKLQESESLKTHFLSNIANEIVNPFTSILGLSKSIMSMDKNNFDKAKKMAEYIYLEAFNLDFQLKNIFAAAEIEAGEASVLYSNVSIKDIVKNILEQFKSEMTLKNINYTIIDNIETENCKFKTDNEKFSLIISNLISNAISYGKDNSKIEIIFEKTQDILKITVKDQGKGITKDKRQKIFDRFNRSGTGINSIDKGHGIGLSICKYYAELLDGDITFNSIENKGTEFILTLKETEADNDNYSDDSNKIFFGEDELF